MFFAKENWIMGGPVHESKESRKKSVRAVMSAAEKKAMDMEIQRQLAEYDRKHIREIDALVLWELRTARLRQQEA